MGIDSISGLSAISPSIFKTGELQQNNESAAIPFSQYLSNALNDTNDLLLEADSISNEFAAGKTDNIQQVLIATEKADIALQFTMQIRNKILDAYNEIMRMQI